MIHYSIVLIQNFSVKIQNTELTSHSIHFPLSSLNINIILCFFSFYLILTSVAIQWPFFFSRAYCIAFGNSSLFIHFLAGVWNWVLSFYWKLENNLFDKIMCFIQLTHFLNWLELFIFLLIHSLFVFLLEARHLS